MRGNIFQLAAFPRTREATHKTASAIPTPTAINRAIPAISIAQKYANTAAASAQTTHDLLALPDSAIESAHAASIAGAPARKTIESAHIDSIKLLCIPLPQKRLASDNTTTHATANPKTIATETLALINRINADNT